MKKEMVIIKSNDFVQKSTYSLGKAELKTLNYLIAALPNQKGLEEFPLMDIKIDDIRECLKFDKKNKGYYFTILQNLRNAKFYIENIDENGEMYKTPFAWLDQDVRIYEKNGYIKCKFNPLLLPYLGQLKTFVKYDLSIIADMTSKYSMRLYELLLSWQVAGKKEFSVAELRERLDAEQKSYSNFNNFKIKVLDGAIQEINNLSTLKVSYKVSRTERKKVTHLLFRIKSTKKAVDDSIIDAEYKLINDESNEKNERFGYYYEEIRELLKKYCVFTNEEIEAIYLIARNIVYKKNPPDIFDLNFNQLLGIATEQYLERIVLKLRTKKDIKNKYTYLLGVLEKQEKEIMNNDEDDKDNLEGMPESFGKKGTPADPERIKSLKERLAADEQKKETVNPVDTQNLMNLYSDLKQEDKL